MSDLLTLHRYYIWANRMRILFGHAQDEFVRREGRITTQEKWTKYFAGDSGTFMSYWYGGLFVIIEGWIELALHDPDIDRLLDSPNVELLKRYRNGVFHFQRDYLDERFFRFFEASDTATWVHELNNNLGRFFKQKISQKLSQNT